MENVRKKRLNVYVLLDIFVELIHLGVNYEHIYSRFVNV